MMIASCLGKGCPTVGGRPLQFLAQAVPTSRATEFHEPLSRIPSSAIIRGRAPPYLELP